MHKQGAVSNLPKHPYIFGCSACLASKSFSQFFDNLALISAYSDATTDVGMLGKCAECPCLCAPCLTVFHTSLFVCFVGLYWTAPTSNLISFANHFYWLVYNEITEFINCDTQFPQYHTSYSLQDSSDPNLLFSQVSHSVIMTIHIKPG